MKEVLQLLFNEKGCVSKSAPFLLDEVIMRYNIHCNNILSFCVFPLSENHLIDTMTLFDARQIRIYNKCIFDARQINTKDKSVLAFKEI